MSAYLIFTRKQTLDEAELNIYWDKIRATFAGHEVRILVNYGRYEGSSSGRRRSTTLSRSTKPSSSTALGREHTSSTST